MNTMRPWPSFWNRRFVVSTRPRTILKPARRDALREQIVLGKQRPFVKPTQLPEDLTIEQHEHSCSKRLQKTPDMLHQIAPGVQQVIEEPTMQAGNVRCHQMKFASPHRPQCPP